MKLSRKVRLTNEEFQKAQARLSNTEKCIGATALKKAYPEFTDHNFGSRTGYITDKTGTAIHLEAFDYKGEPLCVMLLKKPQTIYFRPKH